MKSDQKDRLKGKIKKREEKNKNLEGNDESEHGESEAHWESQDDPNKLWCICQTPHNNRFMVCCDSCDKWYHGKCVGVTRILADISETWICPLCREKNENNGRKENNCRQSRKCPKKQKLLDPGKSKDTKLSNQNDVPELKSRPEYATGRRQPVKTTAKRVGATHVKPMASKPSVYGQQIAPTAQFAPQHNIAPQPPTYGQQRTTNATPITSFPSQQVAPAQPSLYGNQRPSTPSIVSQQAPPLITSQQAPPPIDSQQAPSIQAMQQAAYGTSGSSTFLPAAQAATASMPAKPVFQPTVPFPMAPQALPTSDDEPCRRLLITAPQAVNQEKLYGVANLCTPGLERFYRQQNIKSPIQQHAMFVAEYKTTSQATNALEMLQGLNSMLFDCPGQLFVKFC
ncbi:death-inducer obliterator 1-like isoform X1 [Artemia franciscana]|uniref:death-inducer obliterator 1-like isoform X1 n=1 Tax=Artemia franciscana TaxID=6661 RepID=UPI0032DBD373